MTLLPRTTRKALLEQNSGFSVTMATEHSKTKTRNHMINENGLKMALAFKINVTDVAKVRMDLNTVPLETKDVVGAISLAISRSCVEHNQRTFCLLPATEGEAHMRILYSLKSRRVHHQTKNMCSFFTTVTSQTDRSM